MNKPINSERSYIAFISYRHTPLDSEAAERVQKKIENYIVPKELQKQIGGKKLGLCFRDDDELPASSSLTDSIYYALDHSKFLIVICTPDLPLSKWCEAEIRHFLKTHDRDHILAVLVDGEPSESFSPYMLHDFDEEGNITKDWEPLAANINGPGHTIDKKAFKKEIVRIYAALIGCPFDALWQRERRARTNRMLTAAGAVVAVLAVFLGVVLNRNAQIAAQNEQISAQNNELNEKNDEIKRQNDQITEQNVQIENQNTKLQRELSSTLVEAGINKLQTHDIHGALKDALSATESDDPAIYDPRAEKLLADTLGAYQHNELQCSVVYQQSTDIVDISVTEDESHAFVLDSAGVIRCLDLSDYSVLWEIDSDDPHSRIYTKNQAGQILYKSITGLYCHSLTDGALLWSYTHPDFLGNRFQAVSDDGTWFALLDQGGSGYKDEDPLYLVFINTQDGSERGRVELYCDGYKLRVSSFTYFYGYGYGYSPDNSCFLIAIPASAAEDEYGISHTVSFMVDTKTFESKVLFTYDRSMSRFFCMDMSASDNTVFVAGFSPRMKKIRSELMTKDGDSSADTTFIDHVPSEIGGFDGSDDDFGVSGCAYLICDNDVYIFSDNHMFIYDRMKNKLKQHFSLSGKVINAYWLDQKNRIMEVVCSDGYFFDYTFEGSGTVVVPKLNGESVGQDNLIKAWPMNDGVIYAPDTGSALILSQDYPGSLLLVKRITDPHSTRLDFRTDSPEEGSNAVLLTPGLDTAILFKQGSDNNYSLFSFDKKTGEIKASLDCDDIISLDSIEQIDEDSFLYRSDQYNMDGTVENYAEPATVSGSDRYPKKNLRLTDGSILSWNPLTLCSDLGKGFKETQLSSDCNPCIFPIWLNGHILPGTDDPKTGLLYYYYESDEDPPSIYVGENGLVSTYGKPLHYDGKTITLEEEPLFQFLDADTGTIMPMENRYPESGGFVTALSQKNKWMAAVYDDGTVCIYDPADNTVMIPEKNWSAGEISALCFSPDDAYLLILTINGELDVINTSSMKTVFSESIPAYSDSIRNRSVSFWELFSKYDLSGDSLVIYARGSYTHGILLNTANWTVTQDIGQAMVYDSDNGLIWTGSGKRGVFLTYPVYSLSTLKAWAEEELNGIQE